ncbi:MAG: NUDIX domain-containing protein [bacterium]|nr:NUDIX domain-containing protein [bacterium]
MTLPSSPQGHVQPGQREAALAIIRNPQGQFLWQLRDEGIAEYPGLWGLFGGGVEPGEAPNKAIMRELKEELGLEPTILWDLGDFTHPRWYLHLFLVEMPIDFGQLELKEGQDWGLFSDEDFNQGQLYSHRLGAPRGICPPLAELYEVLRENQFLRLPPTPVQLSRT